MLLLLLLLQDAPPPDEPSRFEFAIRPDVGVDTNLLGIDEKFPVVEALKRRSFFGGAGLLGRYWLLRPDPWGLTIDATSTLRAFSRDPDLNYADNLIALTGWGPTDRELSAGARLALGEAVTVGEGHYRSLRDGSIGGRWKVDETWSIDLSAAVTHLDFYVDLADEQDRDGSIYRVLLSPSADLGDGWKLTPALTFARSSAEGADFDSRGLRLEATVASPTLSGFQLSGGVFYSIDRYDHDNSVAGFVVKRKDAALGLSLSLQRRCDELLGLTPVLAIAWSAHGSNIDAYDYDRWTVTLGVGIPLIGDLLGG